MSLNRIPFRNRPRMRSERAWDVHYSRRSRAPAAIADFAAQLGTLRMAFAIMVLQVEISQYASTSWKRILLQEIFTNHSSDFKRQLLVDSVDASEPTNWTISCNSASICKRPLISVFELSGKSLVICYLGTIGQVLCGYKEYEFNQLMAGK